MNTLMPVEQINIC